MWSDFGEYIFKQTNNEKIKIAEVGVGKFSDVYDFLKSKENIDIIKIDITPADDTVIADDITNPNEELYKDIDIIYSIRPPSELQPYLIKLQKINNSKLIIKPLFNEDLNTGYVKMKLKNYKKASFYIL